LANDGHSPSGEFRVGGSTAREQGDIDSHCEGTSMPDTIDLQHNNPAALTANRAIESFIPCCPNLKKT
jgi:hypothetical protein